MSLVIRARRDAGTLATTLRREAHATNPDFLVRQIATQRKLIDDTLVREKLLATVGTFFGVLAITNRRSRALWNDELFGRSPHGARC